MAHLVSRARRLVGSALLAVALAVVVVAVSFVPVDRADHVDGESVPRSTCVTWRNGAGGGHICYR